MGCFCTFSLWGKCPTIDVEDWYHVCGTEPLSGSNSAGRAPGPAQHPELVLVLLEECAVKATFFILGSMAVMSLHYLVSSGHESRFPWPLASETVWSPWEGAFVPRLRRTGETSAAPHWPVAGGSWVLSGRRVHRPAGHSISFEEGCRYPTPASTRSSSWETGEGRGFRIAPRVHAFSATLVAPLPCI